MKLDGDFLRLPAVRFERLLPGPIDRVWSHLTQCDKLVAWYGQNGVIEPGEGGRVEYMDGHVRGVVTQWRPPSRLAYSWNVFSPGQVKPAYPESYLNFDLAAAGAAVKLTLAHLPVLERFEAQNAMGWHTYLDMLRAKLLGDEVQPRASYMERNAKLYGVDLNNLAR
jgi:uncharacterized protein YndB with AHSA1/START domain